MTAVSDPQLKYDDATHTYSVDGVVYPSVTQVLKEAGLIDETWYTEEGAERGKEVALITEMNDKGELDEALLAKTRPQYVGYLVAWGKFVEDRVIEVLAIEERVFNKTWGYAGTVDRRLVLRGPRRAQAIVDIKSGGRGIWEPLQTAGYLGCYDVVGATRRLAVHLRRNGKYSCYPHENFPRDYDVFRSALCLANWKRAHGKRGDGYGGRS